MKTTLLPRRRLLGAGVAASLACAGLPARACEFFSSNLRVTHPWTRATAEDADSTIVCMKFDEVLQDDRLIGVETRVAAAADLGGANARGEVDLAIPRGQLTELSESGTWLRLRGLTQPLEVGRTYPMRLHFAVGGALRADLSVDFTRFR